MTFGQLLAIVALVIGVLVGADVAKLWFDALTWFILAIALMIVVGGVGPVVLQVRNKPAPAQ